MGLDEIILGFALSEQQEQLRYTAAFRRRVRSILRERREEGLKGRFGLDWKGLGWLVMWTRRRRRRRSKRRGSRVLRCGASAPPPPLQPRPKLLEENNQHFKSDRNNDNLPR